MGPQKHNHICDGIFSVRTGIRLNSWMPRSLQKRVQKKSVSGFLQMHRRWPTAGIMAPSSHINPFESSLGWRADDGGKKIITICRNWGQWPIFCWCWCMDTRHVMGTLICPLLSVGTCQRKIYEVDAYPWIVLLLNEYTFRPFYKFDKIVVIFSE